jgi:apolipoprotein N-acyltransferase
MRARKLRWLVLLGVVGVLGVPLHERWLLPLMGFVVFMVLFGVGVDERTQANLGRAAAFAYLATLGSFVACLLWLGFPRGRDLLAAEACGMLAWALVVTFALHILTFMAAYLYFDRRGV